MKNEKRIKALARSTQAKQYYLNNRERINKRHKQYRQDNKEKRKQYLQDNKEKISKQNKEYNQKNKEKRKQYYLDNKEKINKQAKQYRQDNKEVNKQNRQKNKKKIKQYYLDNRKRFIQYTKQYRQDSKEKIKQYHRTKRINDPLYAIKARIRSRLGKAFRTYSRTGKVKTSDEYGINYKAIIEHLKPFPTHRELFHIDHKKPLASFDFSIDSEIQKAFAPENHQWLLAEENMKKGSKVEIQSVLN